MAGTRSLNLGPAPTTILTQDDFIRNGYLQVGQALDTLPGVVIESQGNALNGIQNGAFSNSATLALRGAGGPTGPSTGELDTSYENLVLQDGEPMRTGLNGSFDLSTLTPAIYSRVELVEGVGGTSLFGANSIGGTLNLVTRYPLHTEGGQILATVGSYGTTDYDLSESNTIQRFGYMLNYHGLFTDGEVPANTHNDSFAFSVPPNFAQNPPCYPCPAAIGIVYHPTYAESLRSALLKLRYDLSNSTYVTITGSTEYDWKDSIWARNQPLSCSCEWQHIPSRP